MDHDHSIKGLDAEGLKEASWEEASFTLVYKP